MEIASLLAHRGEKERAGLLARCLDADPEVAREGRKVLFEARREAARPSARRLSREPGLRLAPPAACGRGAASRKRPLSANAPSGAGAGGQEADGRREV